VATILLTGASGFIGSRLTHALSTDGHRVVALSRRATADGVAWDPARRWLDSARLTEIAPDVVVNLAGEPIARRWTPQRRHAIRESRINATALLADACRRGMICPNVLVSGSAIGYYGAHRGDEVLTESSSNGTDYLAQVSVEWESAAQPARDAGVRVVTPRTGIVLSPDGGALQRMLLPFRLGGGGRLGDGSHWMSWISMEDMVRALRFCIDTTGVTGPVNCVAPNPVRNTEFAATLGRVMHRPALVPVPALALRALFGTMADHTILASQRVSPNTLAGAGFEFRHPRLEDALRFELRRSSDPAGR
jgi:uncharacterized protein (TIGR01777 family)